MQKISILLFLLLIPLLLTSCSDSLNPPEPPVPKSSRVLEFLVDETVDSSVLSQAEQFSNSVFEISSGNLILNVVSDSGDLLSKDPSKYDLSLVRNEKMAQTDSLFSMFSAPFLYDNGMHMSLSLNSNEIIKLLEKHLALKQLKPLVAIYQGGNILVTTTGTVRTSADFEQLTIATASDDPLLSHALSLLDSEVMMVSQERLPELLSEKISQRIINTLDMDFEQALLIPNTGERLYCIKSQHRISPLWLTCNLETWNQLTSKEQAYLQESCAKLLCELEKQYELQEKQWISQLEQQQDVQVIEVERQQIAAMLYSSSNTETELTVPDYFSRRIYELIQSFSLLY